MAKNLVIVESPAKAKTIKKYLGKGFEVLASYGHVRDLLPKEGAVDPANDFGMKFQLIEKNQKHVDAIAKALKKADALYLATVGRVAFNEVTKTAVNAAIEDPRELSQDMIDAQLARRGLDYLVGFNLSPLLWKKIRRGLSAGRVQSPALRLIVERELEIEKFDPKEYWTVESELESDKQDFTAKLTKLEDKKISQFTINSEEKAKAAEKILKKGSKGGSLVVEKIEKKKRKRNPNATFTT